MRGSTTLTAEDREAPFTKIVPTPKVGDMVLVQIDAGVFRPLTVVQVVQPGVGSPRVSGVIHCDPHDHTAAAFRHVYEIRLDVGFFSGRPSMQCPLGYGYDLRFGDQPGEWQPR